MADPRIEELERLNKEHDAFKAEDEWSEASTAAEGALEKSLWQHRRYLLSLARDAERYQVLRDSERRAKAPMFDMIRDGYGNMLSVALKNGDSLDAAIDAARKGDT